MKEEKSSYRNFELISNSEFVQSHTTVLDTVLNTLGLLSVFSCLWQILSIVFAFLYIIGFILMVIAIGIALGTLSYMSPEFAESLAGIIFSKPEVWFYVMAESFLGPLLCLAAMGVSAAAIYLERNIVASWHYSRLTKMLDRWNNKCVPVLNRLPDCSRVDDPDLAEAVREIDERAMALSESMEKLIDKLHQDATHLSRVSVRDSLHKLSSGVKELAKDLEPAEDKVDAEMRDNISIVAGKSGQETQNMSRRQRARQYSRVQQVRHIDSWDKR